MTEKLEGKSGWKLELPEVYFQVLGYYMEISTQLDSPQKRKIATESINQ